MRVVSILQGMTAIIGGCPVDLGAMTSDVSLEDVIESDGKTKLLPDMPKGVAEQLKVIPEDIKLDIPKVYKGDIIVDTSETEAYLDE